MRTNQLIEFAYNVGAMRSVLLVEIIKLPKKFKGKLKYSTYYRQLFI